MTNSDSTNQDLPQFAEGPPMPAMCEALLSGDDIARLFEDLAACTTVLSVQEKGGEQKYAEPGPAELLAARNRLTDGAVRALQVRYAYDERDWTDTLIGMPGGVKLVRCQHPEDNAAAPVGQRPAT